MALTTFYGAVCFTTIKILYQN